MDEGEIKGGEGVVELMAVFEDGPEKVGEEEGFDEDEGEVAEVNGDDFVDVSAVLGLNVTSRIVFDGFEIAGEVRR